MVGTRGTCLILNEKYDKEYVQNDFLTMLIVFLRAKNVHIQVFTIVIFKCTWRPYFRIIQIFLYHRTVTMQTFIFQIPFSLLIIQQIFVLRTLMYPYQNSNE